MASSSRGNEEYGRGVLGYQNTLVSTSEFNDVLQIEIFDIASNIPYEFLEQIDTQSFLAFETLDEDFRERNNKQIAERFELNVKSEKITIC